MLNALTEYEEHRLLENLKKSRNIYSVLASFSLATFDQDLAELSDVLKKSGEVISTLPSVGANIQSSIDFEILFGSAKGFDEMAALVADANATLRLLGGSKAQTRQRHGSRCSFCWYCGRACHARTGWIFSAAA